MNMHDKGSRPLNWHLWHDTNPAILSCVGFVRQSFVGGLSAFCLCSSDSAGTPPDCGVAYPCDTFQTLRWGICSKLTKSLRIVERWQQPVSPGWIISLLSCRNLKKVIVKFTIFNCFLSVWNCNTAYFIPDKSQLEKIQHVRKHSCWRKT